MSKHDTHSVQQLLVAEKKAEERINLARKRKVLRLKQAKEDAQAEIEKLRIEKEKELKSYESKFLDTRESSQNQIEKDTEKSLIEMEKFVKLNRDAIIDYLLDEIFTVDCKVHENFRHGAF